MVGASRIIHPRLEVIRSDDATVVDLTDWVSSAEVELGDVSGVGTGSTGGDGVVRRMRFRLHNETGAGRFSPLDQTSSWNQFAGEYDPLLWPNRQAIFYVAIQEQGEPLPIYPDDYFVLFQGYIGDEIRSAGPVVECELRDLAKRLQDTFIEADKVYAPSDFVDVEQVMQQIINDHVTPAPPSIDVPMPIVGRQVKAYTTEWQSVWDALQDLAAQSALWLGYRFDAGLGEFRLTLLEPPRDKTTPDFTLDWQDDFYLHELDITDRNVRNAVIVEFRRDEDAARERVVRESSQSIQEFGRRAMQIEEGATSLIRTASQAEAYADAALHDLADLTSTTRIDMPLMPAVDVFAGIEVTDPRLSSGASFYGVESVRHTLDFDAGKFRTQVVCAGRVIGARRRWMQIQARPGSSGAPTMDDYPVRANTVLTVAASDAPKEVRRRADMVCDGVDDHVEIQAAIHRVSDGGQIGKVVLSEGTFHVSQEIELPSDLVLQGQGSVSVLRVADHAQMGLVLTNDDWTQGNQNITLIDFAIDGNKLNQGNDFFQTGVMFFIVQNFVMRRLSVFDMAFDGITIYDFSDDGQIDQCQIYGCDQAGVYIADCGGLTISGNTIRSNGWDGISLAVAWDSTIMGNPISNNGGTGIRLELSGGCTITGNTVSVNGEDGISVGGFNARNCTISANTVRANGWHGIHVHNQASHNVIADNNCEANGTVQANTYDNIHIDDYAEANDVQGNVCRTGMGGQVRYGIGISEDAGNDNFVTNNDLLDAGATDDLYIGNDSTVTAPGNRLTGGSGEMGTGGGFRVRRGSNFEFDSGTWILRWDVVDLDTDGMHPGGLSEVLVVQRAGIYQLTASVRVNPPAVSSPYHALYRFRIKVNAFTIVEEYHPQIHVQTGFPRSFMVTAAWACEVGDELSVEIQRDGSIGNRPNVVASVSTITPIFTGVRIG